MAKKKDFSTEAVLEQIQNLEDKIAKLTLVKQQLELNLQIHQEKESRKKTSSEE